MLRPAPLPHASFIPRLSAALGASAAGFALVLGAAATGHAAPATSAATPVTSASGPDVAVHRGVSTTDDEQKVRDYWTPERIAALTTDSSDNAPAGGPDGAPWTKGGAAARTTGRLFFTDHGSDVSCTATVVDSGNKSTVVTAGHCVNDTDLLGDDDQWNGEELFVPGYHDGQRPFGAFVVHTAVAAATWLQNDQIDGEKFDAYDQGFAVVGTNERGQLLQDAVRGAQQIGFDERGDQDVVQFGFPRAASDPAREGLPEYTGERLAYCAGTPREYPGTSEYPDSKGEWGTACVMGGGSSGGPRLVGFDLVTGLGTVAGVNTHAGFFDASGTVCEDSTAQGCVRYLVGPQFTETITEPLYERAQSEK